MASLSLVARQNKASKRADHGAPGYLPASKVYRYLLGGMELTKTSQVWATDIPKTRGFLYLVAIMDRYSQFVVAWNLSNTRDADFCVDALE